MSETMTDEPVTLAALDKALLAAQRRDVLTNPRLAMEADRIKSFARAQPVRAGEMVREGIATFNRYANASDLELYQMRNAASIRLPTAPAALPVSHMPTPPSFNPAQFVRELQQLGVMLRVGHKGELIAVPAGMLPDRTKQLAKFHKALIVAHLESSEIIA